MGVCSSDLYRFSLFCAGAPVTELELAKAMFWHAWHSIFWMPAALASAMFLLLAGVTLGVKKKDWRPPSDGQHRG
jgi:hypothetical protein